MSRLTNGCVLAACGIIVYCGAAPLSSGRAQEAAFTSIEDQQFQAEYDGSKQKYVLMTPRGFTSDKSFSLLLVFHGHGSDRWQFVKQARGECRAARDVAAANKMLLVSPDYRAKTSWMGPAAEADTLQIIRELKTRFKKARRVVLCGGSMGGTAVLTFAALHPKLVDGVVSFNGTANLVDYTRFQDAIAKSFGGSKREVPDQYKKRSAEFFPTHFTMPVAATTGGKDLVVPAESVLRLLDRVRKRNPRVLSLHRTNGGHSTNYDDAKRALEFVIDAHERGE